MARKSSRSARRSAEHSGAQEIEAPASPESAEAGPATSGRITKTNAVRQALAAGKDMPEEAVAYIKGEFGIDITKTHFSAVKSALKKREGGARAKGRPGRKPREAVEGYLAPPPGKAAQGEGDLLAAIEAMKPLVESLGADKVHRIVDLLG